MRMKGSLGWIDQEELQCLLEEFCRVTEVCVFCLDGEGRLAAEGGTELHLAKARAYGASAPVRAAFERVEEGALEEQAAESLNDMGDRVAAIAVRAEGRTVFYWVAFSFDGQEEDHFLRALDLLRTLSRILFTYKTSRIGSRSPGTRFAQQEMSGTLQALEATRKIVELLDSDDRIESVMDNWLEVLARHIGVDTAVIFYINPEKDTMDVVSQWLRPGVVSFFDKTRNLKMDPFLPTDKPIVYSADAPESEFQEEIRAIGVQAMMVFPILRHENGEATVVALNYRWEKHNWSMREIKFTADAVKLLQSILTRRIQKRSIDSSYEALEAILDNVGCGVYVQDKNTGKKLFANRNLQNTFARELQENTFSELLDAGVRAWQETGIFEIYHMERERWYDLLSKEISWVDGKSAILYSLYDITDKKLYQRKIEQQAHTDFLTGLYNRMCCERDLARQIDRAKKTDSKGALLFLDLDDFKHINDGLGHQYGDALLKAISHSLQRIRGIEETCYRMGGDEFVIVIRPDQYFRAEEIVECIQEIFAKPWFLKNADYYCTMSMGIVTFPDFGESVAELIKKADIAMYEAKKSGKNRVAKYDPGISSFSGRRLDMEKNMRDATRSGYNEFEVYYQPIIDVADGGRCAGAEALIRWNSANLGFIPPAEFIPLAEYLGLINPIGNYVLREACGRCRKWNEAGFDYKVNVNLSVVQLLQTDMVEIVDRTLEETGLEPRNLTLEVTESLAINDMDRMKEILNRIKSLGVKIALDDFGTGYSSLSHIREIPFDLIKVDQSFVKELAKDAYSQSFVKMVAELAETLGGNICVEGIETKAQYQVVRDMKVRYIQGYFFDRPMKLEEFEEKYCTALAFSLKKE